MLWDKHEPKNLKEYLGHAELVGKIAKWSEEDDLPHFIFAGPPGTGKTLLAHIVRDHYLKERAVVDFFEYNGSNERGIDTMRKICSTILSSGKTGRKKIFFIDEAEKLTDDAWALLKVVTGEKMYTSKTIFIFATNDFSVFPESIVSRCYVEFFDPFTPEVMREMAKKVLAAEKAEYKEPLVDAMISASSGDMRKFVGTYLKDYIANPAMTVDDLPKGKQEKLVPVVASILKKMSGTEFSIMKAVVAAIRQLKEKLPTREILPVFVEAMQDVEVAEFVGWVSSWMRQGVPEEIALVAFASKVARRLKS
jgi:replication-associated recombination protein RarA